MPETNLIFTVEESVFEMIPDFVVGCVLARGIDNQRDYPDIERLLCDAENRAQAMFSEIDLKEELPFHVWRQAFSAAGWSASKYPASVEALMKRVAKGQPAPRISPAVDLSNAAALIYSVPVGAHDISTHTAGPLTVRTASAGDTYLPLGDGAPESPDDGEIIYTSGNDVRTRRWVWRQSRTALIQPSTRDVFFPIDGFAETTQSRVEAARNFVADICANTLGAQVTVGMVTRTSPKFST